MSVVEIINAAALQSAAGDHLIGRRVVVLEQITSTNDVIATLAPSSREGLVVFAELQTSGRGQYGRRWESAAGKGLWFSILLRPQLDVTQSARLTDLFATAVAATIRSEFDLSPVIKPPNDVYVGTRKVAGVLVEMRVEPGGGYYAVAGVGINVNHETADFPHELRERAVSLSILLERRIDRFAFAVALLNEIDQRYAALTGALAAGEGATQL